jgi:hypothetical protein
MIQTQFLLTGFCRLSLRFHQPQISAAFTMSSLQYPTELKEINSFPLQTVRSHSPKGIQGYISTDKPACQAPTPFLCLISSAIISRLPSSLMKYLCLGTSAAQVAEYSLQMFIPTFKVGRTMYALHMGLSTIQLEMHGAICKIVRNLSGISSQTWLSVYTKSSTDFQASLILWRSKSSIRE